MDMRGKRKKPGEFPLGFHKGSGQYCKRFRGKTYYFGKDRDSALKYYEERWPKIVVGLDGNFRMERSIVSTLNEILSILKVVETDDKERSILKWDICVSLIAAVRKHMRENWSLHFRKRATHRKSQRKERRECLLKQKAEVDASKTLLEQLKRLLRTGNEEPAIQALESLSKNNSHSLLPLSPAELRQAATFHE